MKIGLHMRVFLCIVGVATYVHQVIRKHFQRIRSQEFKTANVLYEVL